MSTSEQIIFVIHTDAYSGNFERELCAYITGQIGECGVGEDLASDFLDEVGDEAADLFSDIVMQVNDDRGCARPCAIYATPGRLNDGYGNMRDGKEGETGYPAYESVAIYFSERPSDEQIELMKSRARDYAEQEYNRKSYNRDRDPLTIKGFELITEITEKKEVREAV